MPAAHKVLGQVCPAVANTDNTLYTVPAGGSAIISSLVVCAITAVSNTFTVRIAVAGGALNNKQYVFSGTTLTPNQTAVLTAGLTLSAGDQIIVQCTGVNNVAFSVFGQEYTP